MRLLDAWEAVLDIDFSEVSDHSGVDIRLGWDDIDGSSGTLGEAAYVYSYRSGDYDRLVEAEIRFDTSENWSTDPDYVGSLINFYAVAAHEIGHAIGLGHPTNPDTLMYAYLNDQTDLTSWDIAGGQVIYGTDDDTSITGDSGNNNLTGTSDDDYIVGGDGNDTVYGFSGDDTIYAGAGDTGDDIIYAGNGNDIAGGGAGDDDIFGGGGGDLVFGGSGADQLYGGDGNDTIWSGTGNDNASGGSGGDVIGGGEGRDTVFAGSNHDTVYGSDDNDQVYGGSGNDLLFGGSGDDTVDGGTGNDELYGGDGNDTFIFEGGFGDDSIGGFHARGDNTIDISDLNLDGISDLTISQVGSDVLIDTGDGTILLYNADQSDVSSADFHF